MGSSYNFSVRFRFQALAALLVPALLPAPAAGQIDPKTALLEQAGLEALEAGDARRAAAAFDEARTADPKNAMLHLGAGAAAYLERRDEDARLALEHAVALDPGLREARRLLGLVIRRQGDLSGAIRIYEALVAAVDDEPTRAGTLETLERWRRELALHDRMDHALGDHFTVSFEGPAEADLAERALASLDRAYWRMGTLLGTYPTAPVAVVLYTTEQFHDITRSPRWAAGAYDGIIRVPMRGALAQPGELDRVLAHEYIHALIRTLATRGVPTWLNEGLAGAFETEAPPERHLDVRRDGWSLAVAAGLGSFEPLNGRDAELAYRSSAAAVRRLVEEVGGAAIVNLLRDLEEGVGFDEAFAHRVQRPFADFAEALPVP
jgi:tetratricopeptide (TPR) repeat protein